MALFKTSSFAENTVKLRHDNRQESRVLDKKINLMRSIQRQSTNNLGLDSKMIAKRLKDNLQRSSQTSAKIGKIKSGMPAIASEHYKEDKFGVVQALKEVWNEDESRGKLLAFANEVTIPAAIHLLNANGYEVEKHVTDKLEDLRKSQQRLQRISKTSEKTRMKSSVGCRRRSSFPHLSLESATGNNKEHVCSGGPRKEVKGTPHLATTRKHLRHRHDSASSTSTSSSGVIHRKVQRMRSQTQPDIFAVSKPKSRSTNVYSVPGNRPTSAPSQEPEIKVKPSTVAWVEETTSVNHSHDYHDSTAHIPAESEHVTRTEDVKKQHNTKSKDLMKKDKENLSSDDEDLITYGVYSTTECPLQELHNKIHTRMEDVTLIDLHRASVVSKNYPGRMKTFAKELKSYKLPKSDRGAVSGDYYSDRMLKESKTANEEGTGRRAVSAAKRDRCLVTSLPSSASRCSSEGEETETEDEYFRYMKKSFETSRNQSLTIRAVSTVWGPSEFIEFVA